MSGKRKGGHAEGGMLFKLQKGEKATPKGGLGLKEVVFISDFHMFKCLEGLVILSTRKWFPFVTGLGNICANMAASQCCLHLEVGRPTCPVWSGTFLVLLALSSMSWETPQSRKIRMVCLHPRYRLSSQDK